MSRAQRGYTYDPCHGCGSTDEPRPAKGVCSVCRAALTNHKAREAEREAVGKDAPRPYRIATESHWWPYIPHDKDRGAQKAFHKLVFATSEHLDSERFGNDPRIVDPSSNSSYNNYTRDGRRMFKPSTAKALNAMFDAIHDGMEHAYAEGKEDGRSLLMGLNDGSLSMDDFERRAGG